MVNSDTKVRRKPNPINTITVSIAIMLAIAGMHHAIFEILQGSTPTNGLVIQAISPEYQRWPNGEEAFTIIPNFLWTGISALSVSLLIIAWSFFFLRSRQGVSILFILFLLLTFVGGGIGHILFFITTCAYATRNNKPLAFWKKVLDHPFGKILSGTWQTFLFIAIVTFLAGLEISVFGLPGISDHDTILYTCWSFLFASFISINLSYIAAFSYVIKKETV